MKRFIILFATLLPVYLFSQIINIPEDYSTIQQGINAATNNDTVLVQPGTYLESINYNGKNITVASLMLTTQDTSYISQTIIDGNQSGNSIVMFENGESNNALLSGFTITNGYSSTSGGAIACIYTCSPRLENLIITGNTSQYNGGAIICGGNANPSFENVFITNNSAGGDGGGIYCFNYSSPDLVNVTIIANNSYHGGGICCLQNCSPNLNNVIIADNSANQGGGIFCAFNSNLNLLNTTIAVNSSTEGGGIACHQSDLVLDHASFSGNISGKGGALFIVNSDILCSYCEFNNNDANITGGAISYTRDGDASKDYNIIFSHCNFEDNSAEQSAGAVKIFAIGGNEKNTDIVITDSYFKNNLANNRSCLHIGGENVTFNVNNTEFSYNEAITYVAGASISNSSIGTFNNCLFYSNNASIGGEYNSGGVSVWSDALVDFINCTFAENSAAYGSALTVGGGGIANVVNCIIWGNLNGQIALETYNDLGGILSIDYSNIQYGVELIDISPLSILNWGDSNIDQDPLFFETGVHYCQINDDSPCINAANPDTTSMNLPEFDLAGEIRIFNDTVDIGAYEWNPSLGIENFRDNSSGFEVLCYPNPFYSMTIIKYELLQPEIVQLSIYNDLGKLIYQEQEYQQKGKQQFLWNAEKYSHGIYIYRLQLGTQIVSRKIVLLK